MNDETKEQKEYKSSGIIEELCKRAMTSREMMEFMGWIKKEENISYYMSSRFNYFKIYMSSNYCFGEYDNNRYKIFTSKDYEDYETEHRRMNNVCRRNV